MRAPVLHVGAVHDVEVARRGRAEGRGVGELGGLRHHRDRPDRDPAEAPALVRLQVERGAERVAGLADQRAAAAGDPALVDRRVRARVALLADQSAGWARPRRRAAGAPSGSAARTPSSPRSRAARARPRAAASTWSALASARVSISSRGVAGGPKNPVSGFSTITCLPARAASIAIAAWRCGRHAEIDQVHVRIGEHRAEIGDRARHPELPRVGLRPLGSRRGHARELDVHPAHVTVRSPWMWATKPAPTMPTRTLGRDAIAISLLPALSAPAAATSRAAPRSRPARASRWS